jgi:DNA methylase
MRDVLPQIKAADLVVTDPPYVVGLASSAQDSGKVEGWADLMNAATWYGWWLREGRRLTAPGGAAWVFNSWRSFPALARGAWEARWPIESLLVWDKQAVGTGTRGLRPRYELVALSAHRRFKIPNRRLTDIHPCRWPAGRKPSGHPAGKPVPLLRHLIEISGGQRSGFSTRSPARAPPWPPPTARPPRARHRAGGALVRAGRQAPGGNRAGQRHRRPRAGGTVRPVVEAEEVSLYHGDCRDVLPELPAESVDLVLTDPPYGKQYVPEGKPVRRMNIRADGARQGVRVVLRRCSRRCRC